MNSTTLVLRTLAMLGAYGEGLWVVGFLWEAWFDRDATTSELYLIPAVVVAVVAAVVFWLLPTAFVVRPNLDWRELTRRLVVGALVSYPILALLTGLLAAGVVWSRGFAIVGEAAIAVWLLALWLPLWVLPLSASVVVWIKSRNAKAT